MVGDAVADIQTGINAGCHASIAVESGMTPKEKLFNVTPHVVSDISAIRVQRSVEE